MRVYSYIRVSSKGQVEGDGPERQRESIGKFCLSNNLTHVKEFFEPGLSGTVEGMDRPVFSSIISLIEDNPTGARIIVVERMDRLARDLMVQEFLLAECRKRNIKIFSADRAMEDVASNEGDPTRVLIRQVLGALSQWEKSALVQKLRSARERVKAEKGRCEGAKFYGHYPGEAALKKFIIRVRQGDANLSYGEIGQLLTDGGFLNRRGKPYNRKSARELCIALGV